MAKLAGKISLVVDDSKKPEVALQPGQRLDVVAIDLVSVFKKPKKIGGRLCGGTSTCLALIDVSK